MSGADILKPWMLCGPFTELSWAFGPLTSCVASSRGLHGHRENRVGGVVAQE